MRYLKFLSAFALVAALLCGCERYEQVPENSAFQVTCDIKDGTVANGAVMTISVSRGATSGACTLDLSLKEKNSGGTPSYRVLANGRTSLDEGAYWAFDGNGEAMFQITGLPAGTYHVVASVNRWYHSASCESDFVINN